jgi:quinone-modifying oxidoreductase subunit QmoA
MNQRILVIGGGISGITAAVELAEAGREVVLIEKESYLGGRVSGFHNYFPKLCPPSCGLEINFRRIRSNPRITYYTGAEVTAITGSEGDFTVNLSLAPRLINNRCTACGKCAQVCPVALEAGPGGGAPRKAAYMNPSPAFPMKYTIDAELCLKDSCAKCLEVCSYDAIQLDASPAAISLQAGRIIVATGWQPYPAEKIGQYAYTEQPDVVTNIEFEQILSAARAENRKPGRPSDGTLPGRVAFVQCAGSRDQNHLPYCSAVCCAASVKHALTLAEEYPGMEAEIFYIDLRLTGRNEMLLRKAEGMQGITLTKGKVGKISGREGGLVLEWEDVMKGMKRTATFDLVVLATGMVPAAMIPPLRVNEYGFAETEQPEGIIPAATCRRPMDVSASVKDATSAALKAMRTCHE